MSFAHIKLEKISANDQEATYAALTPDFNEQKNWEIVANIVMNNLTKEFEFHAVNYWSDKKVVPPHVYLLDSTTMQQKLDGEFLDHHFGAWTGRIASHIRKLQMQNSQ